MESGVWSGGSREYEVSRGLVGTRGKVGNVGINAHFVFAVSNICLHHMILVGVKLDVR